MLVKRGMLMPMWVRRGMLDCESDSVCSCHCCELASAWRGARPGQLLGCLLWRGCGHHSGAAWRAAPVVSCTSARSSDKILLQQGSNRMDLS